MFSSPGDVTRGLVNPLPPPPSPHLSQIDVNTQVMCLLHHLIVCLGFYRLPDMQCRISFGRKLKVGIKHRANCTSISSFLCMTFSEGLLHMACGLWLMAGLKNKDQKMLISIWTLHLTSGFPASLPASDKWQHPGNSRKSH